MAITSTDIQNQSFAIDRKGYMVDEVDDFLEHVADEIDELNARIADLEQQLDEEPDAFAGFDTPAAPIETQPAYDDSELQAELAAKDAQIAALQAQLDDARADGNAIAQALIVAQRSADDIVANARARAEEIIGDAQDKADAILDEVENDKRQVEDAISTLEEERASVRAEYQEILKDFIADATNKLSALNKDEHASAHARIADPVVRSTNQVPIRKEVAPVAEEVYTAPAPAANQPVVVAATPVASPVEKDFSGFGDTDDFSFDDID